MRGQRVGDALRAAPGHRPADRVGQDAEHEAERGGRWPFQRHHGMDRHAREHGAAAFAAKEHLGQGRGGSRAGSPKRTMLRGWRGKRSGPSISPSTLRQSAASGPISR